MPEPVAKEAIARLNAFEGYLAPQELLQLHQDAEATGDAALVAAIDLSASFRSITAGPTPHVFDRQSLNPTAILFRGTDEGAAKGLIVGMTGAQRRLMMPMPLFLQSVEPRQWDVLLLADPLKLHYRRGNGSDAASFLDLVRWVETVAAGYPRRVALGTSIAGLPAVRLALMLGFDRAISVGGRFWNDSLRLLRREADIMPAFDPLCACLPPEPREVIHIASAGHPNDLPDARRAASLTGGALLPVAGVGHNPLWDMHLRNQFPAAMQALLDLSVPATEICQRLADARIAVAVPLDRAPGQSVAGSRSSHSLPAR